MVFYCICRKCKFPFLTYKALYYLVFTYLFSFVFHQVLLCLHANSLFLKYFKFITPMGLYHILISWEALDQVSIYLADASLISSSYSNSNRGFMRSMTVLYTP